VEQLEAAEAGLVPAEEKLVPVEEQLVPAEDQLVPAEAGLVSTRSSPRTERKKAPLAVTEGSGPVLSSKREAGATAVHAEATGAVEGAELCRHACPCWRSRGSRGVLCKEHPGRGAMWLVRAVVKTSCPAGTREFMSARSSGSCHQQKTQPGERTSLGQTMS
jgi:hypothetical protein